MDESNKTENRRTRRSNVLMTAMIELSGGVLAVKLRNLSVDGALIEGDALPIEGAAVVFKRNELAIPGRIAWVKGKRAGITFTRKLALEAVLNNIPSPKPRVIPEFPHPGLTARALSVYDLHFAEAWAWRRTEQLGK